MDRAQPLAVLREQYGGSFEARVTGHSHQITLAEATRCQRSPFDASEHGADHDAVRKSGCDFGMAADETAPDPVTGIANLSQQLGDAVLGRFVRRDQTNREKEPGSSAANCDVIGVDDDRQPSRVGRW